MPSNKSEDLILYITCYQCKEEYHLYGIHSNVLFTVWIFALSLIIPITLTNLFAVRVFMKKEQMKLPSNILLVHTAICDAMFGCISLPIWSSYLGLIVIGKTFNCILMGFSFFFALTLPWMSFLTTFLIAIDKHIAIFYPYYYELRIQKRRHVFTVPLLVFWLLMIAMQLTWFSTEIPLLQLAPLIIPILCIYSVYVYLRIYTIVKRTKNSIRSQQVSQNGTPSGSTERDLGHLEDMRVVRLTSLMLVSLCLCYLPYFGLQISRMVYGKKLNATIHTALPVVLLVGATKCLINPLLYYHQKQAIRNSVIKVRVRFTQMMSAKIII